MTVAQNDVLRVTAEMTVNGHDVQNVYHYRSTNVPGIGDTKALADCAAIMEDLYQKLDAQISTGLSFDTVRVQNITQDVLLGALPFPLLTAGADAAVLLPEPVSALITYPTAQSRVRGGAYYGGFTEDQNTASGTIGATLLTQLAAVVVDQLVESVFGADSYRYIVFNAVLNTFVLPVSGIVHSVWRTQRRRRTGVGT